MKYLLLLILAGGAWWYFFGRVAGEKNAGNPPPAPRQPEAMVQCARCGVYLPAGEALRVAEAYYCCAAHRPAPPGGQG